MMSTLRPLVRTAFVAVGAALILVTGCTTNPTNPPVTTARPVTDRSHPVTTRPAEVVVPAGTEYWQAVAVERVIDGDTVVLRDGRTVRIAGIDTPETKHPQVGIECYGPEASEYATVQLEDRDVMFEPDGGLDRYGRDLGHLWYEASGDWVNYGYTAILDGYATRYRAGRHRYRAEYEQAERYALDHGAGLWLACP